MNGWCSNIQLSTDNMCFCHNFMDVHLMFMELSSDSEDACYFFSGWNNLLFLWGVFRQRKKKSLDDMPVFQKLNRPNLNMEPLDQDLPTPITLGVSSSSKISSHENSNKELSRSERSPKRKKVNSTSNVDFRDHSSSGIKDRTCNAQEYSFIKPLHQEAVDNNMALKLTSCSLPVSSSGKNTSCTCPESNLQMNSEQSYLGVKYGVGWLVSFTFHRHFC